MKLFPGKNKTSKRIIDESGTFFKNNCFLHRVYSNLGFSVMKEELRPMIVNGHHRHAV